MQLKNIQKQVDEDTRRWFPKMYGQEDVLVTQCLGLIGETGEVVDEVKKWRRGTQSWEDMREKTGEELADLFIYVLAVANELAIDLEEVYHKKRMVNEERFGGVGNMS